MEEMEDPMNRIPATAQSLTPTLRAAAAIAFGVVVAGSVGTRPT